MRTEITFGGHTYPLREPMGLDAMLWFDSLAVAAGGDTSDLLMLQIAAVGVCWAGDRNWRDIGDYGFSVQAYAQAVALGLRDLPGQIELQVQASQVLTELADHIAAALPKPKKKEGEESAPFVPSEDGQGESSNSAAPTTETRSAPSP